MPTHTLTIEDWHPTLLNAVRNRHWSVEYRAKRRDAEVYALMALAQCVPVARGRRRLHMLLSGWEHGGQLPDRDGPLKVALDAMKRAGLLLDDGPAGLEGMPLVEVVRGPKRTVITLEDVQGEAP